VVSVRFAIELALGRITLPHSRNPNSRLARHEAAAISRIRSQLHKGQGFSKDESGSHRNSQIEAAILPLCFPLMQAIGHRMAYDAAIEASVDPTLIDIYLSSVILSDSTWYSEAKDPAVRLSGSEQLEMQLDACTRGVARLEEWLDKLEVEPYIVAPIVSEEKWDAYEQALETFGGPQDPEIEPSGGDYVEELHVDNEVKGSQSAGHSFCHFQSSSVTGTAKL